MSGSFIASNGSLTLVLDIRLIPTDVYQSSNLFVYYAYVGEAASVAQICRVTFSGLATLNNHTPCNTTFITAMSSMLTSADTCVAFRCNSTGMKTMTPAEFVNVKIGGGFCSPTNSSDCSFQLQNAQGGVNLADFIYPVTLVQTFNEMSSTTTSSISSSSGIIFPTILTTPINSSSSVQVVSNSSYPYFAVELLITVGPIVLVVVAIAYAVFRYMEKRNNTKKTNPNIAALEQTGYTVPLPIISSASASGSDSSNFEYPNATKQSTHGNDMFEGMGQLQRTTSSNQYTASSSQPLPAYATLGHPPAYSDTVSKVEKSSFDRKS